MNEISQKNISIVIPLAPAEKAWRDLYRDISKFLNGAEIIFVCCQTDQINQVAIKNLLSKTNSIKCIKAKQGRALQLNAGARKSKGSFVWFLHADSRLSKNTVKSLLDSLNKNPQALHYFNLDFLGDGPALTKINALGCWVRSHFFKSPFGDQGFCISKKSFTKIGGFLSNLNYGEDHIFVWRARENNIPVKCVGSVLKTSARKYRDQGWLKITAKYFVLWNRQVWPEYIKYLTRRAGAG